LKQFCTAQAKRQAGGKIVPEKEGRASKVSEIREGTDESLRNLQIEKVTEKLLLVFKGDFLKRAAFAPDKMRL